eukprot:PITA_12479
MGACSSTAASTSTSLNPGNTSNSAFDVFLNHRGPDVKKTFASYLYRRLTSYGLKVFLDREELRQGDYFNSEIKGAIRTASVHVAIFSAGYADSTWCLNELVMMLESGAKIIPVFYQVEPSDLRWTQGKDTVYAQSLKKLGEKTEYEAQTDPQSPQRKLRHNAATIEKWRNALSEVSGISGFDLQACNGDEGLLLDKVVESVLGNVNKPLDVAKYPTGLEEKVSDFENQVLQSGRKVQVVGIIGLGGVGKTTLAKELFNRKRKSSQSFNNESSGYASSCFLDDVRENVVKGSLIILQRRLLRSLTGSDLQIENKHECRQMLKRHLLFHKILLVLDDVDTVDQIDELVPDRTCIHSDSLILITSRDKDVLTRSGVQNSLIYKLGGLSTKRSLKLFCQHAFGQSDPLPGFENLAQGFVNACDGLPLSLKVFGGLLHGNNDLSYWSAQLVQLQRTLPEDIKKRLQISYEALNEDEKQVFLDIACFFIGQRREMAISVWNVSKWGGWLTLQNLQNKCLVEVDSSNLIRMHDHLRDLAISEASVKQPFRFCHFDDLVKQSTGIITVRGIRMVLSECHDDDDDFDSIQMERLHLVDTEGSLLERILKSAKSPNLIWLRWNKCPYSSLPRDLIPMKKLKFLRVSGDKLETLWQQESQLPLCLEELDVQGCVQLKNIWGLAHLTKLQRLDVSWCFRLEELSAKGCTQLKRIRGLEYAGRLQRLDVSGCAQLDELSSMKYWAESLEYLSAEGCTQLKRIRGLEYARGLQRLDVSGCAQLDELPIMKYSTSLEYLSAEGCTQLKRILVGGGLFNFTQLQRLDVSGCLRLEELSVVGCMQLKRIRGLEQATKLQRLIVRGCVQLDELPSMELLTSLEELSAEGCTQLKSIRGLEQATKLKMLNVSGCAQLDELPSMELLTSLETLWARGCSSLKRIRGLEQATKLQVLDVSRCSQLDELPSMELLTSMKLLWADGCCKLKNIRGLCTQLLILSLSGCCELEEVECVEHCTQLEEFDASRCPKLQCPVWE